MPNGPVFNSLANNRYRTLPYLKCLHTVVSDLKMMAESAVENDVEKEEIACYEQLLLFLECFQKTHSMYCKHENQGMFGKRLTVYQTIEFRTSPD